MCRNIIQNHKCYITRQLSEQNVHTGRTFHTRFRLNSEPFRQPESGKRNAYCTRSRRICGCMSEGLTFTDILTRHTIAQPLHCHLNYWFTIEGGIHTHAHTRVGGQRIEGRRTRQMTDRRVDGIDRDGAKTKVFLHSWIISVWHRDYDIFSSFPPA